MVRCAFCSANELLPFKCRYCNQKFCREHYLPEKHDCRYLTKERWRDRKKKAERLRVERAPYKKAYEVPGVLEAIERKSPKRKEEGFVDVDEKLIAAAILLLIIVAGIVSRFI